MENTDALEREGLTDVRLRSGAIIGLLSWLFIVGLAYVAILRLDPPDAVPVSAPLTDFSSGRAMKHLRVIARGPHPIGSNDQTAVRDYILREFTDLGIHAEIQSTTAVNQKSLTAGMVKNIVARLKVPGGGRAVMLAAHYDSVLTGPGASDDGSAVAALLETARALKVDPPLRNDIIFLLTDGEEVGMLGAKAFMAQHPWAKDVGLALNFEARGNGGPVVMFETSERNGKLIEEFAQATPYPLANSMAYEVYRLLLNDTDLSVFKQSGLPSLNFAYFYGLSNYHTSLDNLQRIDERSLQHQGSYALALARRFGNSTLDGIRESNAVYFDFLGLFLIHYSTRLVLPATALLGVLFGLIVWLGLHRGQFTLRRIFLGALAFLLLLVTVPLCATIVWRISRIVRNIMGVPVQADIYNSRLYVMGIVALTIAIFAALLILFQKRVSAKELIAGAQLWWLILLIISTLLFPSGSYLLAWPLLFSLLAAGYLFTSKPKDEVSTSLVLYSIAAIPAILLIVPITCLISHALALQSFPVVSVMVTLLLGLLIPQLQRAAMPSNGILPIIMALIGVSLITIGSLRYHPSSAHPKTDSIFYSMSVDSGKAIWASADSKPDEWTSQFFSDGVRRDPIGEYVPHRQLRFISTAAPALPLMPPEAVLLDDQKRSDGVRVLRLHVTSPRRAQIVRMILDSDAKVLQATVNGNRDAEARGALSPVQLQRWELSYFGMPEQGIEVTLELQASSPVKLRVIDQSYGLPQLPERAIQPRPDYIIAAFFPLNDSTLVVRSFTY
jgi:Peptidase family M28